MRTDAKANVEPTDPELLEALTGTRQSDALDCLYRRYRGLAYCACTTRLRSCPGLADDAVQTVFLILNRKAGELRGREVLSGWIYRTAVNVSRTMLRGETSRKRREKIAHERAEPRDEATETHSDQEETFGYLHDVLSELPPELQNVIMEYYFNNKKQEEIARGMRCSVAAVKMRLLRARKRLKKKLEKKGIVLSLAALIALLETEAEAVQESGVGSQVSVGEASETAKSLADSVLREMARQGARKAVAIAASTVATLGVGTAIVVHTMAPGAATEWRVASITGDAEVRAVDEVICEGDVIRTGAGQEVELRSDVGERLLLREETVIWVQDAAEARRSPGGTDVAEAVRDPRQSKTMERGGPPPHRSWWLGRGAIVAELKRPVRFETEHGVVESDENGADFWLMVAESTNAFTRVDVTEGVVEVVEAVETVSDGTQATIYHSPFTIHSGKAVCFGSGVGPALMPSDGREFSPKYGGIFFRDSALGYACGAWGLESSTECIGEPMRVSVESFVEDVEYFDSVRKSLVTPAPSPDYSVRAEDETIRIVERSGASAHIEAWYPLGDVASWPGVQVDFEISIRKKFAEKHGYVSSTGGSLLTVEDLGVAAFEPSQHGGMRVNRWYSALETRLLVGRLPDRRPVYERQLQTSWMPKPCREFLAGGLSRIVFSVRECELAVRNITIRRRKHVDVGEAASGKQTEEGGV